MVAYLMHLSVLQYAYWRIGSRILTVVLCRPAEGLFKVTGSDVGLRLTWRCLFRPCVELYNGLAYELCKVAPQLSERHFSSSSSSSSSIISRKGCKIDTRLL